ncbi:MAG: hypothetical protein JXR20_05745 [Balneola sp.]
MDRSKMTFQVFKSGYIENHEEEKLLPLGVEEDSSSSIQANEEEHLFPADFNRE